MKNIKLIYIFSTYIFIGILVMTSCSKDFLDKDKLAEETTATYFVSQEKASAAVTAAYSELKDYRFGWFNWAFGETMSDNTIYGGSDGDNAGFQPLKTFNGTSAMFQPRYKWQIPYRGIGRANQAIANIEKMDNSLFTNPALKKRLIAEARFLRAYYHFELIRAFGFIPIVNKLVLNSDEKIMQSKPKEVYEFIIGELKDIEGDLPTKSQYSANDLGRITKGAAQGLLAKVCLYNEDWAEAKNWATKVINSGEYQLEPDFAKIFSLDNEHGSESIFEISFHNSTTETSAFRNNGNFQTLFQLPRNITYGYGINLPTQDLHDAFVAEGDNMRMNATLLTTDEVFKIELAKQFKALEDAKAEGNADTIKKREEDLKAGKESLKFNRTGFYNKKIYLGPNERSAEIRNNPNNFIVLRLGEMYLILAEAAYKSGDAGTALTKLNELRAQRALPAKTVSGDELLNAIYIERRLELALENDRYHDLVRTGRASKLPDYKENRKYWPIPQNEIDNSNGTIKPNSY